MFSTRWATKSYFLLNCWQNQLQTAATVGKFGQVAIGKDFPKWRNESSQIVSYRSCCQQQLFKAHQLYIHHWNSVSLTWLRNHASCTASFAFFFCVSTSNKVLELQFGSFKALCKFQKTWRHTTFQYFGNGRILFNASFQQCWAGKTSHKLHGEQSQLHNSCLYLLVKISDGSMFRARFWSHGAAISLGA